MARGGRTLHVPVRLGLNDGPLHAHELRRRVPGEPDGVSCEQLLPVGDKPLELTTEAALLLHLTRLQVGLTPQVCGALLTRATAEPGLRGDAGDSKGRSVLDGHVSIPDDRGVCGCGQALEVRITRNQENVGKRVRPLRERLRRGLGVIDDERLREPTSSRAASFRLTSSKLAATSSAPSLSLSFKSSAGNGPPAASSSLAS